MALRQQHQQHHQHHQQQQHQQHERDDQLRNLPLQLPVQLPQLPQHPPPRRMGQPPSYQYPPTDDPLKLPPVRSSTFSSARSASIPPTLESLPSLAHTLAAPEVNYENATRSSASHRSSHAPARGPMLRPLNLPHPPSDIPARLSTPTDAVGSLSMEDATRKRDPSVSMDDPDDRMAAEALCGLGKVDSNRSSARSPSGYETPLQYYPLGQHHAHPRSSTADPEPLLSLLTSSHPWLGGTINNSLSAYSSTKSFSPRFIQYGANFVERNIGSPMAHTVGSVGRKTGVEGSLRRYLGSRRSSDLDRIDPEILGQPNPSHKRRRISSEAEAMDVDDSTMRRTVSGTASIDTLPVYDENRSPAYEDSENEMDRHQQQQQHFSTASNNTSTAVATTRPSVSRSWSTQLMISTSGLGAALNEPSLRSLKYCLGIIRGANTYVRELMDALKKLLSQFDKATGRKRSSPEHSMEAGTGDGAMQIDHSSADSNRETGDSAESAATLAQRIQHLNGEIWQTLKNVVNTVSRYTGGALPENASVVVRWQLMSVPRRWQRAVSTSSANNASAGSEPVIVGSGTSSLTETESAAELEAVGSAHRMLAFAIEGIDMMDQVGGVVDSTISSAEKWLESLGKKTKQDGAVPQDGAVADVDGDDTPMGDANTPQAQQDDREMLVDTTT